MHNEYTVFQIPSISFNISLVWEFGTDPNSLVRRDGYGSQGHTVVFLSQFNIQGLKCGFEYYVILHKRDSGWYETSLQEGGENAHIIPSTSWCRAMISPQFQFLEVSYHLVSLLNSD